MKNTTHSVRKAVIRLVSGLILLTIAFLFYFQQTANTIQVPQFTEETVAPTCTDSGYSLYQNLETGETTVTNTTPALGHSFSSWELVRPEDGVTCAIHRRVCTTCSLEEQTAEYPDLGIARLSLYGSLEGIGKKSEVSLTAQFQDNPQEISFDCYATLKYQGHSALTYPKKNYTLKFYRDEARTDKYKITFSHWRKENKYILKANYIDPSHSRNLLCADIWADMCASRENLAPELQNLSNYGAVDGFPIALYINDEFHGLYTMNLHKDDDLFGMADGETHAIMICNETSGPDAFFRAKAKFADDSPWEVEYCGTEDSQWAQDSLNHLIDFVRTADDAQFRSQLNQYLDVDAAIDYLIALHALGLPSNGSKDLLLVTYGAQWIPSLYDMEDAFGLHVDGTGAYTPDADLPAKTISGWDSATDSLLWDRLLDNFEDEIYQRYTVLRDTILVPESLCTRVSQFHASIPELLYTADALTNPSMPQPFDQQSQITTYIHERIHALDSIFYRKDGPHNEATVDQVA